MSEPKGKRLPDHLPIVDAKLRTGDYRPYYREREITRPVDLCDARGSLNRAAVGWSRRPLVRANLSRHWLRKKKWNFWNWISPRFVLSVTLADIDYASFCAVAFTDFETGENASGVWLGMGGRLPMPEHVEEGVAFAGGGMEYSNVYGAGELKVDLSGRTRNGGAIGADFVVRRPPGHESLNVVVPWSPERFQLNSKHNTLPCEGCVEALGKRYVMKPEECHAVQDFGRGVWPYRSFWNWAVCSGVQDGCPVGVNLGGKWTTGTGANENGICVDGRLHKLMEDVRWEYDPRDWMKPWRLRSEHSDAVDLTLRPVVARRSRLSLGLIATRGVCCFGRFVGVIRCAGEVIELDHMMGWAEEFAHRW